eukprot:GHVP01012822.1.p1 GENE.GHVP01012822.1~~GHVP01012822.1.p1  ORF type:complete len:236 (+),score=5.65 GHVP01012822.1:1099-1806(+)
MLLRHAAANESRLAYHSNEFAEQSVKNTTAEFEILKNLSVAHSMVLISAVFGVVITLSQEEVNADTIGLLHLNGAYHCIVMRKETIAALRRAHVETVTFMEQHSLCEHAVGRNSYESNCFYSCAQEALALNEPSLRRLIENYELAVKAKSKEEVKKVEARGERYSFTLALKAITGTGIGILHEGRLYCTLLPHMPLICFSSLRKTEDGVWFQISQHLKTTSLIITFSHPSSYSSI